MDERFGFRSRWKQQRHPTNPTKTKNPIIKNGETRGWIKIHPELRVNACQNWRRRSNKNGETRGWTTVHPGGGNRHWLQSTRIATCCCERSRKFPRARQKRIESHRHQEALQADLQRNNVYNPLSNNSKEMIRELGNVELFELCETFPKVQCSHCLLIGIKELSTALAGNSWLKANPEENSTNYDWMHSLSRSTWWRNDPLMLLDMARPKYKKSTSGLECVEEMLQKSWLSMWAFQRYSRSLSQRPNLSWITTINWLDQAKVQRDGQIGKARPHVPSL